MSAAVTRSGRSRRAPDQLCAEAVELARAGAEEAALPGMVGEHLEAVAEGDRVVTHYFACLQSAYRGWRWASTVARASRGKVVTLDESVLLPGQDALLAPEWVPWNERLRPGDLGPGDLLPTQSEDLRLEPGFTGEDAPPPNSVVAAETEAAPDAGAGAESAGAPDAGADAAAGAVAPDGSVVTPPPSLGRINSVADELGMARPRVLSRYGLHAAADRWEASHGANTAMAQAAPANCVSCGFLAPLAGSLRQAFGVCANEFSPADGHVVSLSYGCGGHSEAAVTPKAVRPPLPVIDETQADELSLEEEETDLPEPGTTALGTPANAGLGEDDFDDIADIPDPGDSDAPRSRPARKSGRSGKSGRSHRNGRPGKSARSAK